MYHAQKLGTSHQVLKELPLPVVNNHMLRSAQMQCKGTDIIKQEYTRCYTPDGDHG
jgi:hypothetical protein